MRQEGVHATRRHVKAWRHDHHVANPVENDFARWHATPSLAVYEEPENEDRGVRSNKVQEVLHQAGTAKPQLVFWRRRTFGNG